MMLFLNLLYIILMKVFALISKVQRLNLRLNQFLRKGIELITKIRNLSAFYLNSLKLLGN